MRQIPLCLLLVICVFLTGPEDGASGDFNLDAFGFGEPVADFPAFDLGPKALIKATLVPESTTIAPGKPFLVVLTLEHADGHYSYWQNPGGPGAGTDLAWKLPPGFAVSPPSWPAPEKYANGPITSYVYRGKLNIVYSLTPPPDIAPGEEIVLEGALAAQACTPKSCNPVHLPLSLTLTAAEKPGEPHPSVRQVHAGLPASPGDWRFEVSEHPGELVIAIHPAPGYNPDPGDIHFFDAGVPEPVVDSQKPQTLTREAGQWWLTVPTLPGASRQGGRLEGIITAANGWNEDPAGPRAYSLDLPVLAESAGKRPPIRGTAGQPPLVLLAFAFLGGLLLNVMPCVFPVIGLKIMGFAKQAHKDRRAVFLHGLAYTAGVLICFWTLSFLVITMGRGWGAQLQSDWFMFALCHVFMIMSMNMAGVFDVGSSMSSAGNALSGREGLKRSFFTGLLATITSTPCSAPFLGTALAYALSLPALLSLGVFTLMGLGFAFPYLALSLFPNWLKRLPKPGPWMDTFRQAMCFPLFGTTAYLFWTMEGMLDEWHFLMLLFGLVLTAMACWLYGKHQRVGPRRRVAGRLLMACAAASLAAGLWLGLPKAAGELTWMEWSPEIVSRLREEGRPVYIDFTARWCATCQLNKRVYEDKDLADLFLEKNVALLKADWTKYDDRITSTLRDEFNKAAVPVTVLYAPGEERATVLPDILTVANVSEAMQDLPDWVVTKR